MRFALSLMPGSHTWPHVHGSTSRKVGIIIIIECVALTVSVTVSFTAIEQL